MEKSLKFNYFLTLFDLILGIAFPLITFPYVTRILSPSNLGHVQFYLNIVNYIVLFSSFGIPLYGVREVAKVRNNIEKRNRITIEILILHLLFTAVAYVCIIFLSLYVSKIREDIPLFLVLSTIIIFSTIGVPWFFQAIEDFKYITIRALFVRIVSILLLFIFVRTREDILNYGIVIVCGSVANNIFNLIRLNKYISFKDIKLNSSPFKHIKPASKVFLLNLTVGIYTQLSVFLLGFLQSDEAVGYYSVAQKIITVLNTIVLSLTTVLLPRLSMLVGANRIEEFKDFGNKAFSFVLAITIPICVALIVLSRSIVLLLCGPEYEPSIIVLKIWAPILIIIGISQIYGKNLLYSTNHESLVTKCTFIGMIAYLTFAIPGVIYYSIVGASLGSLFGELFVTGAMIILGHSYHPCTLFCKQNLNYVIGGFLLLIILFILSYFVNSNVLLLLFGIILGGIVYLGFLGLKRDVFYFEIYSNLLGLWKRLKKI